MSDHFVPAVADVDDGDLPSPSVTPGELSRQASELALESIAEQSHQA